MNSPKPHITDIFIGRNFYRGLTICVLIFIGAQFVPATRFIAFSLFFLFVLLILWDYKILFIQHAQFTVQRIIASRMNNGEENQICWLIKNPFPISVSITLIEEWPKQFQFRNWSRPARLKAGAQKKICWKFQPVSRGEYQFGNIHLFVQSPLNFLSRRFTTEATTTIPCYPAILPFRRLSLQSDAIIESQGGNRRVRRIGQSMEFEQIKEYVTGDDIRNINWKATARRNGLMVNQYAYERAQRIYCIIDKGRLMKMPFYEMTLLDYAINSSLNLSAVCLNKKDRIGLLTFSDRVDTLLAADDKPAHLKRIMEALYKQETDFLESDFEALYQTIRSRIKNRSMLILFTNFESRFGLQRQLRYLRALAKHHLLVVVIFENAELKKLIKVPAGDIEMIYQKAIAEEFVFEKKLISRELAKYGINIILTKPGGLTTAVINKYLELKSKFAL